jgi:hypothetical protein
VLGFTLLKGGGSGGGGGGAIIEALGFTTLIGISGGGIPLLDA